MRKPIIAFCVSSLASLFVLSGCGLSSDCNCPACPPPASCEAQSGQAQSHEDTVKKDEVAKPAEDKGDTVAPEDKKAPEEIPMAERDMEGQKEVFDFIKAQKTYYIATVENDQPRVRPFGTIDVFEDHLYIQTGRKKNVSKQMEANGKIELCTFDGNRWLRLAATAIADDRIEVQKHMLDAYPSLQKMYQPGDGNTVVYKLVNVTATFSSFTEEDRVIKF